MILKNNTKGLVVLNYPDKGIHITLIPGNNQVSDKDYAAVKESAKFEIEHELISEVNVEVKEGKPTVVPFEKLSEAKAKKLIEGTTSIETLEEWLKAETRQEIRAVLQNKIDEVKNYSGPGSEPKK